MNQIAPMMADVIECLSQIISIIWLLYRIILTKLWLYDMIKEKGIRKGDDGMLHNNEVKKDNAFYELLEDLEVLKDKISNLQFSGNEFNESEHVFIKANWDEWMHLWDKITEAFNKLEDAQEMLCFLDQRYRRIENLRK